MNHPLRSAELQRLDRIWSISVRETEQESMFHFQTIYGKIGGKMQTSQTLETCKSAEVAIRKFNTRVKAKMRGDDFVIISQSHPENEISNDIPAQPPVMLCKTLDNIDDLPDIPLYVQPKLDGVRCVLKDGHFFSRGKNSFTDLGHISVSTPFAVDGELYADNMNFDEISGLVRRQQADKSSISFHIFDILTDQDFCERTQHVSSLTFSGCRLVPTHLCHNKQEIRELYRSYVSSGYEGIIIRYPQNRYQQGRSMTMLKYKEFFDAECVIVGCIAPTTGKETGAIIFVLQALSGELFNVRPIGSISGRKEMFKRDHSEFIGRLYRFRYQEIYDTGVPRFPVGVGFVDDRKAESTL